MLILSILLTQLALATWKVNDISILLPLPKAGEESKMLAPNANLLPKEIYEALPTLLMQADREILYRDLLKVVAIRIDGCFRENAGPCQKQIRLVWQPVTRANGKAATLDAALHSFYFFDDASFASLLTELRPLRLPQSPPKLGVHPTLAKEGYGEWWSKFSTLIKKHCRRENINRITAMTVNPAGVLWTFSGFDIKGNELQRIVVPRTGGETVQAFAVPLRLTPGEFRSRTLPEPNADPEFFSLLRDSREARRTMPEESLLAATKSALRLENPRLTDPGQIDCVSCHSAHVVPSWSLANFRWDWESAFANELYARLDASAPAEPVNVLRAFGYFEERPVVSRRMANEAEEAAAYLNENSP